MISVAQMIRRKNANTEAKLLFLKLVGPEEFQISKSGILERLINAYV